MKKQSNMEQMDSFRKEEFIIPIINLKNFAPNGCRSVFPKKKVSIISLWLW